ncbi:MAG TPA: hypothetical protein VN541_10300 [Tepidisphaeraceae bacterium]|nr:hypothetical protein [Tepidisphaeraceae bacterium]
MPHAQQGHHKLAFHGPSVELTVEVPELGPILSQTLGVFAVEQFPSEMGVIRGSVHPYREADVIRRLPGQAQPLHRPDDLTEIYADEDRFWAIDDRWGMCEINVLRGQWQSWVLPGALADPVRLADSAVLWPMAQLLKNKGVHLIPAVSADRDGFSVLVLAPFGLEPELVALLANGYRVIGQRWTAVREEEGKLALLNVPGMVELPPTKSARNTVPQWVDLTATRPELAQRHGFCGAVLVAEAGRRPRAHLKRLLPTDAANLLKRAWPIPELLPNRRHGQLPLKIAQQCRVFQLQLSRNPTDIVALIDSLRSPSRAREVA